MDPQLRGCAATRLPDGAQPALGAALREGW